MLPDKILAPEGLKTAVCHILIHFTFSCSQNTGYLCVTATASPLIYCFAQAAHPVSNTGAL